MNATETQRAIVTAFAALEDWPQRYDYLVELGRRLAPIPPSLEGRARRLARCSAEVRIAVEQTHDRLHFRAVSNSAVLAGLIALLVQIYSGRTTEEILNTRLFVLDETGFARHLSARRQYEFAQIADHMRSLARDATRTCTAA